ncbi:hypothetical protein L7F22_009767 [Adiantum nelumboides]|nr:hypothetical protein [Adiantum nelumboides]
MLRRAGDRHWYAGFVEHRGRRTGRIRRTPIVAHPVEGGFAVALPYGDRVDWLRNLQASGSGRLRSHGRWYRVDTPRVVPISEEGGEPVGRRRPGGGRHLRPEHPGHPHPRGDHRVRDPVGHGDGPLVEGRRPAQRAGEVPAVAGLLDDEEADELTAGRVAPGHREDLVEPPGDRPRGDGRPGGLAVGARRGRPVDGRSVEGRAALVAGDPGEPVETADEVPDEIPDGQVRAGRGDLPRVVVDGVDEGGHVVDEPAERVQCGGAGQEVVVGSGHVPSPRLVPGRRQDRWSRPRSRPGRPASVPVRTQALRPVADGPTATGGGTGPSPRWAGTGRWGGERSARCGRRRRRQRRREHDGRGVGGRGGRPTTRPAARGARRGGGHRPVRPAGLGERDAGARADDRPPGRRVGRRGAAGGPGRLRRRRPGGGPGTAGGVGAGGARRRRGRRARTRPRHDGRLGQPRAVLPVRLGRRRRPQAGGPGGATGGGRGGRLRRRRPCPRVRGGDRRGTGRAADGAALLDPAPPLRPGGGRGRRRYRRRDARAASPGGGRPVRPGVDDGGARPAGRRGPSGRGARRGIPARGPARGRRAGDGRCRRAAPRLGGPVRPARRVLPGRGGAPLSGEDRTAVTRVRTPLRPACAGPRGSGPGDDGSADPGDPQDPAAQRVPVTLRRCRPVDEVPQQPHEPVRLLGVREVPGTVEDLQPAVGQPVVCGEGVGERDDPVAVPPDQEHGHLLEQVQALRPVEALAGRLQRTPRGLDERAAGAAVGEGLQRGVHTVDVRARHTTDAVGEPVRGAPHPRRGQRRRRAEHQLGARQARRAQREGQVVAETAGGHEHDPLGELGELVRELHRDAAAERVPDDRRPVDVERGQQVPQPGRVPAEGVVAAARGLTGAVAEQVGRDHVQPTAQRVEHRCPGA